MQLDFLQLSEYQLQTGREKLDIKEKHNTKRRMKWKEKLNEKKYQKFCKFKYEKKKIEHRTTIKLKYNENQPAFPVFV